MRAHAIPAPLLRTLLAGATLLLATGLFAATGSIASAQGQTSRELAGIAEEQALLQRQLQRLESTMEVLLDRIEAEGRSHTAELLRDALARLHERTTATEGRPELTAIERMDRAREAIEGRQLVQSLEHQAELISELEVLLGILLDRKNLESLEDSIRERRELEGQLDALADREDELQRATAELRESASNEAQQQLEAGLDQLIEEQRNLLRRSEQLGRESGTLALEQIEQELAELLRNQTVDAAVLAEWDPSEAAELASARRALEAAQEAEAAAARLEESAEELARAAGSLEMAASDPERQAELAEQLAEAAERAARHARVTGRESATRAAEALESAREAARQAADGEREAADVARELAERAAAIEKDAERARQPAHEAREAARAALEDLAGREGAAGAVAREASEELGQATREEANRERTREATDRAARTLEKGTSELEFLSEALAGSQASMSQEAQRLQRSLEALPQSNTESGEEASADLAAAAEAMRQASSAARNEEAESAARAAEAAREALERATEALEGVRAEAAAQTEQGAATLAQEQREAAAATEALRERIDEASMDAEAREAVRQALEQAAEAMQRAGGELSEGKTASAAGSQREALSQLSKARSGAEEGVRPRSEEDLARAEELARQQEEIREQILDLARRVDERKNARPTPGMDRASEAAQKAEQSLREGDLSAAEQEEETVEQELRNTRDRLREEEEQYQKLRQEEQLFRIAEEVAGLIEGHRTQITELAEIHAARSPGQPPSRAQKLRLRRVAREEAALGARAGELADAIEEEQALVSATLMRTVESDLVRISRDMGEEGDYQTGDRTRALQRDVEDSLVTLHEALRQEQQRRRSESQQDQQQQDQQEGQNRPGLIPDTAELKLLARMETNIQVEVEELLRLYPELETMDVDELVLDDITRIATKHEALTELFKKMRERIGVPAPPEE